ncbi:MAG: membrane dipeptidase [Cyclobacteriaceae bacterium]|jgi:membrane dipeptidase
MKGLYILFFSIFILFQCTQVAEKVSVDSMTDEQLMSYANELAHKFIIADGHVDLPYRMKKAGFILKKEVMDVSTETTGNFDYVKAKSGGLDAPFMSIYIPSTYQVTGGAKGFADSLISMVGKLPVTFPDLFALANSPTEISANFDKGLISLPLGMENGAPIEDDIKNVEYFHSRGIRYITLTHGKDNQICDSSYDTTATWNGLSPFGEEVVREMNRVGVMVDISHVSDSAFYDVMKIVKIPVIASHSSCRFYTPGFERNMSDDMIKVLGENGGVIHINFGSTFLSKASREKFDSMEEHLINYKTDNGLDIKDSVYIAYARQYAEDQDVFADVKIVADHIDRVVELAGIETVAFGSDFDGVGNSLPNGLKDVSMYPNVIYELLKRGYTESQIEQICYKNTFRVWNKVIEASEKS